MEVKKRKFRKEHWDAAAKFINDEFNRRLENRADREKIWDEIDRQIAMKPIPLKETDKKDADKNWFPNTELPLQATALEVLQADSRRLTFPRNREWYKPHSEVSDEYLEKWQKRREAESIIGSKPIPMKMDQETADIIVKATLDYYHGLFNFRDAIDYLDIEAIKYGTYAGRVMKMDRPRFENSFHGITASKLSGPAVVPVTIKHYFPDDSVQTVMMEGMSLSPAGIRRFFQRADDIKLAAAKGDGWLKINVANLDIKKPQNPVTMIEYEGDLIIPQSRESIFLPNVIVTVAVSDGGPKVVRFREIENNRRTYFSGLYEKESLETPYGSSPLMKGQPLQEMASLMFNALGAAAALSAQPPVLWDATEHKLIATGGPSLYPGVKMGVDDPQKAINIIREWNIIDIASALNGILKQYEDLTGVTAPRRGAQTKSHTTAFAVDVENTRGLVRTDDYIQNKERMLNSVLSMEYEIARETLSNTAIFIGGGGLDGFIKLSSADLPTNVLFDVIGSTGPATEREAEQQKIQRLMAAAQLSAQSQQQGGPVLNFEEAMREILGDSFANVERFITQPEGVPSPTQGSGSVQGTNGVP